KIRPGEFIQIGVMRAPDQISRPDTRGVNHTVGESQLNAPLSACGRIDATAFLRLVRTSPVCRIEHDAVARLEDNSVQWFDGDRLARYPNHASAFHSAMSRSASPHHRLMICAADKIRTEPARIDLLQLAASLLVRLRLQPRPRIVDGFAIRARRERNV